VSILQRARGGKASREALSVVRRIAEEEHARRKTKGLEQYSLQLAASWGLPIYAQSLSTAERWIALCGCELPTSRIKWREYGVQSALALSACGISRRRYLVCAWS
jgi:hypothetical protein